MNIVERRLATILARNWWVLLLRGLAAITFGVLAWTRPGISLVALVLLFGAYTMADGILGVWTAIEGRKESDHWWVLLLAGLLSIGVGCLTFTAPGITAIALLFYIAAWAIATGVLEIIAAIRLRQEIEGEWMLVLGGVASILFGSILMFRPGAGALALLWMIATYAVVFGVILVMLGLRLRGIGREAARA